MKLKNILMLVAVIFLSNSESYAWGPKGQEITALLAESYLTPKAKTEISNILGRGQSLSRFSSWADQIRSSPEWSYTAVWHYINVADDGTYDNTADDPASNILQAINHCTVQLKGNIPSTEKVVWLKFLIHLIGDLHQPMHVGRDQDRGGNSVQVSYGKVMNLHFLWDSAFIEKKSLSPTSYARILISQNRNLGELSKSFKPEQVLQEDFTYRSFIYSYKNDVIDSNYEAQAFRIVDERLWTGGIRLSALLNSIFESI